MDFWGDVNPTMSKMKAKVNNWGYIKLKRFCTVEESMKRMRRLPTEGGRYLHITHLIKLIFIVYKECTQLNNNNKTSREWESSSCIVLPCRVR